MPRFESRVDAGGDAAQRNRGDWLRLIEDFRMAEARTRAASDRALPTFKRRGQLPPRVRIARALDPGSPFLELATLAGWCQDGRSADETVPGAGIIAGIGYVRGVRCMIQATDSGIDAGAIQPMGLQKQLRVMAICLENNLPFLHLVESAGANLLNYRVQDFVGGGGLFRNLARLSAAGIPVITVVHGSSTAGGAYMPGLSDYNIMVRGRARAFLAGPPLLRAATGEIATEEELGGAEMHAHLSGLCEYLAEDDADAIRLAREVVGRLDWPSQNDRGGDGTAPHYDAEELLGIVPLDGRKSYDVREVVARIVDSSDLLDFKPLYGPHTVCLHACVDGHRVGIIGNNGPIDPQGATKASHFIQTCCQNATPILYLQNTTGYIVGRASEEAGMIKHGAKMIQAVTNANVPQITLFIGASYGAGNYGMCGRAYEPRFAFSWPNAKISVMGAEQASMTMRIVAEAKAQRTGQLDLAEIEDTSRRITEMFESQSSALYTSGLLLDDGVIDPRDTRRVLSYVLSICREGDRRVTRPVQFSVGRH
ncbi:MAG TPA: carboxyl transferase domain-containing protein [Rhodocyclaceae bacterium]|nr:carboxyl transferase domain-containing protein [Rhodocyclaceae bacterium]